MAWAACCRLQVRLYCRTNARPVAHQGPRPRLSGYHSSAAERQLPGTGNCKPQYRLHTANAPAGLAGVSLPCPPVCWPLPDSPARKLTATCLPNSTRSSTAGHSTVSTISGDRTLRKASGASCVLLAPCWHTSCSLERARKVTDLPNHPLSHPMGWRACEPIHAPQPIGQEQNDTLSEHTRTITRVRDHAVDGDNP
jgi:hypothetical protein